MVDLDAGKVAAAAEWLAIFLSLRSSCLLIKFYLSTYVIILHSFYVSVSAVCINGEQYYLLSSVLCCLCSHQKSSICFLLLRLLNNKYETRFGLFLHNFS